MKRIGNIYWFYGRSGAGKSTLAQALQATLAEQVILLDSDQLRRTVSKDLGFSQVDRDEHHRRLACLAVILADQGVDVVVASMAPEYSQRDMIKLVVGYRCICWIYVDASLETCISRDPKGLYKVPGSVVDIKTYPFQEPRPDEQTIIVNTDSTSIAKSIDGLLNKLDYLSFIDSHIFSCLPNV